MFLFLLDACGTSATAGDSGKGSNVSPPEGSGKLQCVAGECVAGVEERAGSGVLEKTRVVTRGSLGALGGLTVTWRVELDDLEGPVD